MNNPNQNSREYVNFARLTYCQSQNLSQNSCGVCQELNAKGYRIINVQSQVKDNINFNMVVSTNQNNEIVISFGGPRSDNADYFQRIYQSGLINIPELRNMAIEKEFWDVYNGFFRQSLINQFSSGNQYSKIVFVGHSFGGSLAQLAAFDLVNNNYITRNPMIGPFIYTYGSLKIGSQGFISSLQSLTGTPLIRIKRRYDLFTLIPRCVFLPFYKLWHCYRNYVSLVRAFPLFGRYYIGYSPFIRRQLVSQVPSIVKQATQYIKQTQTTIRSTNNKVTSNNNPNNNQLPNSLNNQNTQRAETAHRSLNSVLNNNNNRNMFNDLSGVFNNHRNEVSRDRLNNHNPLQYPNNQHHQSNDIPKERLAHHTPLAYSNSNQYQNYKANSVSHNNFAQHSPSVNNHLSQSNNFASHTPMQYSGLHSQSISNSNHLGSLSKSRSSFSSPGMNMMRRRGRFGFLETKAKIKRSKNKSKNVYSTCVTHMNYVSCPYNPNEHQMFFGINIENCN
jgi:hypothetical protein